MVKHKVQAQILVTYTITDDKKDLERYGETEFNRLNIQTVGQRDSDVDWLLKKADTVDVTPGSFQFVLSNIAEPGDDNYIDPHDENQNVTNVHPETRVNPTAPLQADAEARRDKEKEENKEASQRREDTVHGKDGKDSDPPKTQEQVVEEGHKQGTADKNKGENPPATSSADPKSVKP